MGIKEFMISFIFTSILFLILFFPTIPTKPITRVHQAHDILQSSQYPIRFSYLISASKRDVHRLKRTLRALYHPANHYLLHLDMDSSPSDHLQLSKFIATDPTFNRFTNVWIVNKSNLITYRGPTMLANTLHAMSILLRSCNWDWFINLSASDYPLVTQDDLIHAFAALPRHLNFIQHSGRLGWKINKRAKPIMIDPALHSVNKSEIICASSERTVPTAFRLFTGSAWVILSRSFAEYTIVGWDNLPRNLLLYYTNFISSPEGYFQTLICNSNLYKNTSVNHDLHFISWDNPPKQHPRSLGLKDYRRMVLSSVPFARKFKTDDPVLDKIDRELLKRHKSHHFAYGGWCNGSCSYSAQGKEGSSTSLGVLRPGAGSRRLKSLLIKLLYPKNFKRRQCRLSI